MPATKAELESALAESDAKVQELSEQNEHLTEELKNAPKWPEGEGPAVTVYTAWNNVMRDVQAISKDSRNSQQGFNFRGIDAVMNAVGPALRKHGVTVVPSAVDLETERYTSKSGGQMANRVARMVFKVYGPAGDSFQGVTYGEAADSGDKSTTKAESVALRTFLLQALMIPTDDPDPDSESHERAIPVRSQAAPAPVGNADSAAARDKLKALAATKGWDLNAIANKFSEHNKGTKELKDATGDEVEAFTTLLSTGTVTI